MELPIALFRFILRNASKAALHRQRYAADRIEMLETGTIRWLPGSALRLGAP